ncbi:hypothetical protein ACOJAS_10545, partial [Bifidobacterium breve]|uniref:hypothetical protein n=1 Tax=Bifidobacterium breve TaxID=1685 RepID=UPI003D03802E
TAMVLHPTGCGRVARRRIQLAGSPDGFNPPGLPLYARKTLPGGGMFFFIAYWNNGRLRTT